MNAAANPAAPGSHTCAACRETIAGEQKALLCRGCGYVAHETCHKGARLCPKCTKPLVTPKQAAGFAESRAQAKRKLEYRVSALAVVCVLISVLGAVLLQTISSGWPTGWLAIPGGLWVYAGIGIFVILSAAAFVTLRRPAIAITALLLTSALAIGFMPGANVCLGQLFGRGPAILSRLSLVISAAPMCIVLAAWWELGRWKQIPGDSGGVKLKQSESALAAVMEALASGLPAAVSFWLLLIPQRKQK